MNERIQAYVNELFKGAPQKRRIMEIKEELLSNMNEKYNDMLSQGKSADEAYAGVVSGVGDINSLIDDVTEVERRDFADTALKKHKANIFGKKYLREDDTFVEEYKEKLSKGDRASRLSAAISSLMWTVILLIYFMISFMTEHWESTWVIFLVGAVLQQTISSIMQKKIVTGGIIWTSAVVIYFVVSIIFQNWEVSWLIFPAAAAVQQAIRFYRVWREEE